MIRDNNGSPVGPGVVEMAEMRLRAIKLLRAELDAEERLLKARIRRYRDSSMIEAERVATAAEPFQATQLPEGGG